MQSSLFFPTNGIGDGASQYTDAQLMAWLRRTFLRSITTEGVHAGFANELAVSFSAGSTVNVATGAALVDGIPYENTAVVAVVLAVPSVGTTGHRIVLRANWAAQTVRVFDIASADGVAAIPAVVQTMGTTYDITLATLTITTGSVVTITDARAYCHYPTKVSTVMLDDLAIGTAQLAALGVTPAKIALDAIDDTLVGNRVPALTRRQGGNATNWHIAGTTTYTPTTVRIQVGIVNVVIGIGNYGASATITYPVAFGAAPLLFATAEDLNVGTPGVASATASAGVKAGAETTQMYLTASRPVNQSTAATWSVDVHWFAVGTE